MIILRQPNYWRPFSGNILTAKRNAGPMNLEMNAASSSFTQDVSFASKNAILCE